MATKCRPKGKNIWLLTLGKLFVMYYRGGQQAYYNQSNAARVIPIREFIFFGRELEENFGRKNFACLD